MQTATNCVRFLAKPQNVVFLVKFSKSIVFSEIVPLELLKSGKIGNCSAKYAEMEKIFHSYLWT